MRAFAQPARAFLVLATTVALAACSAGGAPTSQSPGSGLLPSAPTGPELSGKAVHDEAADDGYKLKIAAEQDRYRAGQLIDGIVAELVNIAAPDPAALTGSGGGLVGFAIERDSPHLRVDPVWTMDCVPYSLPRDQALTYAFSKSGGYAPEDPNADFFRAYFASRQLRLPAGRWTITAIANFNEGTDCRGPLHNLSASISLTVEP
jgi:hypothetical protein